MRKALFRIFTVHSPSWWGWGLHKSSIRHLVSSLWSINHWQSCRTNPTTCKFLCSDHLVCKNSSFWDVKLKAFSVAFQGFISHHVFSSTFFMWRHDFQFWCRNSYVFSEVIIPFHLSFGKKCHYPFNKHPCQGELMSKTLCEVEVTPSDTLGCVRKLVKGL